MFSHRRRCNAADENDARRRKAAARAGEIIGCGGDWYRNNRSGGVDGEEISHQLSRQRKWLVGIRGRTGDRCLLRNGRHRKRDHLVTWDTDGVEDFRFHEARGRSRVSNKSVSDAFDHRHNNWLALCAPVAHTAIIAIVRVEHYDAHPHRLLRVAMGVERYFNAALTKAGVDSQFKATMVCTESNDNRRRQRPVGCTWKIYRLKWRATTWFA